MPPSIVGDEIDMIGKKRSRDKDPLLRLVEESSADEAISGSPNKRQKVVLNGTASSEPTQQV